MNILLWGMVLFVLAFCLHLLIWKIHIPGGQTSVLLLIFTSVLVAGLCWLWIVSASSKGYNAFIPHKISEYLHISFLFFSLALAYIATYPAIEVDSPSLVIVKKIAETGGNGLNKDKLAEMISDDLLVKPRIQDIVSDKLAYLCAGKYKLTARGLFIARVFNFYRGLLNASKGG